MSTGRWFTEPAGRGERDCLLFCLPYSGGGASVFRSWQHLCAPNVDVLPLHLPGREDRITEPLSLSPADIARAIAARADRPFAIYGHSLGARIGFEVVRALRRLGGPLPVRFYPAAARPPDVTDTLASCAALPDDEFLAILVERLGASPQLRDVPELRQLVLPVLHADFRWINQYRYHPDAPLPVPIVALAGAGDPEVGPAEMAGWLRHTSAGFRLHTLGGGHFFLHDAAPQVCSLLSADLAAATAGPAASGVRVPASDGVPLGEHVIALPGTEWRIWRDGVLRTTGFPADGLRRLAARGCAAVADAYLDGTAGDGELAKALDEAQAHCSREVHAIAADPLFREAVTWQSPSVLIALDGIVKAGPEPPRNSKQGQRERIVARYWQRYCAKTETIGFFGPVCWVNVDADAAAVTARPGPGLLRDRRIFLEHWALASFAERISADHRARPWLPPALQPHLSLDGDRLLHPAKPPLRLSKAEHAVLAWCDGRRPACDVARSVLAASSSGLRKEADVYLILGRLAERDLLRWNLDLPISLDSERLLRERLDAIGDPGLREQALAGLDRLCAGRDDVAAAAGDPDALGAALRRVETDFGDLTGTPPKRRAGQAYAARTVCAEDTTRDLEVTVGAGVLEAIAAPLAILLTAARWLSAAMAEAYLAALRDLHAELSADLGTPAVPAGQLWFLAQGLFYSSAQRPADLVMAELGQRLRRLYGTEDGAEGALELASAELRPRLGSIFPAQRPGWSAARIHSPDLLICAESPAAIRSGDFTVVLSELHASWASCASGLFVAAHPGRARLRAAYATDVGTVRIDPLLPADWPRHTSRLAFALGGPDDIQLGFAPAPGADPDRLVPISAVSVVDTGGQLMATGPGGRSWPLAEVFARPLAEVTVDAFKLAESGARSPRITIDRVVVARQTWRTTVAQAGLAAVDGDRDRYVAARRWRRELGLPDQVFVLMGTEAKPVYADLTSPLYVSSLCTMLRAAQTAGGGDVPVTVTEMLPTCDQAWVPDAAGRRYFSELRLHACDPRLPSHGRLGSGFLAQTAAQGGAAGAAGGSGGSPPRASTAQTAAQGGAAGAAGGSGGSPPRASTAQTAAQGGPRHEQGDQP